MHKLYNFTPPLSVLNITVKTAGYAEAEAGGFDYYDQAGYGIIIGITTKRGLIWI